MNEQAIFVAALREKPTDRPGYLERVCGADESLRQRVEQLLIAHERAGSFLENPALASPSPSGAAPSDGPTGDLPAVGGTATFGPDDGATSDRPGRNDHVGAVLGGKYKLIEEIGEGGMGSVFMAQQTEPVKRAVAVKVIKAGMDSKAVLARFEAERQALAMMDHPNIARVLDAGTTEGGRSYFVMELVKGVPITQFCDERKLTPRQRLELFVPVCNAIQHAHQKGIIHRDIKPNNVLVALYDDRPVPKVIDFGVAKATGQSLTDKTLLTGFGAVVGTPEYMSPEQASLNNLDIDTRSDVYSLGVLLYELLTGSTPMDRKSLGQAALLEVLRIVREVEAQRPSAKLSTSDARASISANRGTEPAKLSKLMKGELDWVLLKALEKDRTRRYDTANGLARDIQKYLADEIVEARPASTGYRLRKFVKRHKGQVFAASLVVIALLAGMAGTTFGLLRADQRRLEAEAARAAEVERAEGERVAKLDAEAQKDRAQKRLAQIEKINELLGSIFENLDPKVIARQERPLQAILVDNLDKAVAQLEGESVGEPLAVAAMQLKFGISLIGLGEPGRAVVLLEKSTATRRAKLGPKDPATLTSMNNLALAYARTGKEDLALPLYIETLKARKEALGETDPDTLSSMHNLADLYVTTGKPELALPLLKDTLKLMTSSLGKTDLQTINCENSLAILYRAIGNYDLAVPLLEALLERSKAKRPGDHPDTLVMKNTLATCYHEIGRDDLARPLMEETHDLMMARFGPEHHTTLDNMGNLAIFYQKTGRIDLAIPLFEEVVRVRSARLGTEEHETLRGMSDLANAYLFSGREAEALPLLEKVFKLMKEKPGREQTPILCMSRLAAAYQFAGRLDDSLRLFEESVRQMKAKMGPTNYITIATMNRLIRAYAAAGKLDAAQRLLDELLSLQKPVRGDMYLDTLRSMNDVASSSWRAKQFDRSIALHEDVIRRLEATEGRDSMFTLIAIGNLGVSYRDVGRLVEAIPLLEERHRGARKYSQLGWVRNQLLDAYQKAGANTNFVALIRESLTDAHKKFPKDSAELAQELVQIGSMLLEAKAFTEAEPILREGLAIREKTLPDDWRTFNTRSTLGGALLGLKKYPDAEPLLLKGYEGMKAREKTIPVQGGSTRIPEALDRLIELYTATNKPAEAKKWRAERAKYPTIAPPPREKK